MSDHPVRPVLWARALSGRTQAAIVIAFVMIVGAAIWLAQSHHATGNDTVISSQSKVAGFFYPSTQQWATLTVEPVQQRVFRAELTTEGKIAVDEDRSTPIFSPYAGRVTKLLVKPGDVVERGQPLISEPGGSPGRLHLGRGGAWEGPIGPLDAVARRRPVRIGGARRGGVGHSREGSRRRHAAPTAA